MSHSSSAYEIGPPPPPRGVTVDPVSDSLTRTWSFTNQVSAAPEIRGRVARITGKAETSKELTLNFDINSRVERALILTQTLNVRKRDTFRFKPEERPSREVSFFKIAARPAAQAGERYPVRFYFTDRFGDESNRVRIYVEVKRKRKPGLVTLLLVGAALVGVAVVASKRRERERQERPEDYSAQA